MSVKEFAGKVALVTGGSRGLGAATARRLARLGADVAVVYGYSKAKALDVVDDARGSGVRAAAFQADFSQRDQVRTMVDTVATQFKQINILVNSAGIFLPATFGTLEPEQRDRQTAVNVDGVVTATFAAVDHMPDGGRIVNIGSVGGSRVMGPGYADYAGTKGAVAAYGRAWAHDLAPRGITVNTVEVGFAQTDMVIPADSDLGKAAIQAIPLRRYARADEIAAVVAFLAGPDASYITGSTLTVDGGRGA